MNQLILSAAEGSATSGLYHTLLSLGIIVIVGFFVGKLFELIKIPHITGYLVAGILLGPSVSGIVTHEDVIGLELVTNIALGFIAFGIGAEILFKNLRKTGVQVVLITLTQALFAVIVVLVSLLAFGADLWLALILGAIATATAPGPIMMLTKKYRAKGPVTDTMLPLVGLDDAIGIIVFGVLLSVGVSLYNGHSQSLWELLKSPLMEILLSAIVGSIIGYVTSFLIKKDKSESKDYVLIITLTGIILSVAISQIGIFGQHLSIILTPMVAGVVFANTIGHERLHRTVRVIDDFNPYILVAFFTIAGAHLDLNILFKSGSSGVAVFGVLYILARAAGKLFGSWLGAVITKADPNVRKWLGITLLPQAGVAIGMANAANTTLKGDAGTTVLTIVLAATVIYELFGPIGVKIALQKSGEINS